MSMQNMRFADAYAGVHKAVKAGVEAQIDLICSSVAEELTEPDILWARRQTAKLIAYMLGLERDDVDVFVPTTGSVDKLKITISDYVRLAEAVVNNGKATAVIYIDKE